MTEISVLMPVRDGQRFLVEAIDSILRQSLSAIELIIVDDGSTDGTSAIIADYARRDARVRPLGLPPSGIVAALEAGRAMASAPLLARMDADDIALPRRLELQRDQLRRYPQLIAVGGQVDLIDAEGRVVGQGRYPLAPGQCRAHLDYGSPFCHPAVLMRAAPVARIGGYRSRFAAAEDYDFWLRLDRIGGLANLPDTVLRYRRHGANLSRRNATANAIASALALLEAHEPAALAALAHHSSTGWGKDWTAIEARLPEAWRLTARASYLRALTLNGGIVEREAIALLQASLSPMIGAAKAAGGERLLAFTLVRAAWQLARNGQWSAAAQLLGVSGRHFPGPTADNLLDALRRRLQGRR